MEKNKDNSNASDKKACVYAVSYAISVDGKNYLYTTKVCLTQLEGESSDEFVDTVYGDHAEICMRLKKKIESTAAEVGVANANICVINYWRDTNHVGDNRKPIKI